MSSRGIGAFASGLGGGLQAGLDRKERTRALDLQAQQIAALGQNVSAGAYDGAPVAPRGVGPVGGGVRGAMPMAAPGSTMVSGPAGMPVPAGQTGGLFGLIRRTEGGGDYSALYGFSQRDGGRFAGTDVSNMTLGQLRDFSSPSGAYGQWVRGEVGRVATPMGAHQIVGTTLRHAALEMGLPDTTVFNATTQDAIANHLASRRLSGASSMAGKLSALRSEWEGFRNVSDADLSAAIRQFEAGS